MTGDRLLFFQNFSLGQTLRWSQPEPTCPLSSQVPRLLGTLSDPANGGGGAGLFFGMSARLPLEDETARPFTPAPPHRSGPGETGTLNATSFQQTGKNAGDKTVFELSFQIKQNWRAKTTKKNNFTGSVFFFFPFRNKLRNPPLFFSLSLRGASAKCQQRQKENTGRTRGLETGLWQNALPCGRGGVTTSVDVTAVSQRQRHQSQSTSNGKIPNKY